MKNSPRWAWLLVIAIVLSGCTAPSAPSSTAPGATATGETTAPRCPGPLPQEAEPPSNKKNAIIVGGLAQDIARLSTWMNEQGGSFGPVSVKFPFSIDDNTAFLDGQNGVPQPDWFAFDLTQRNADLPAISKSLFNVEPNELDRDTTYVIAKAQVTPSQGVEYISPSNLDVFGAAQIAVASDMLFVNKEIKLPVIVQVDNTVNVTKTVVVDIDPNGVGAHGCGELTPTTGVADLFWDQWALQYNPGIRVLPRSTDLGCAWPPSPDLAGVAVPSIPIVVFDTAPIDVPRGAGPGLGNGSLSIPLNDPCNLGSLNVSVTDYLSSPVTDMAWNRHGLFVAGLVYAAWRHADIHLARVIGNDGKGDLFTLLQAMMHWREMLGREHSPAVFNLSLGIDPATATFSETEQAALDELVSRTKGLGGPSEQYIPLELDNQPQTLPELPSPTAIPLEPPLPSPTATLLETVIRLVTDSGIGIVAAAGNDYNPGGGGARPPQQYPAAYKSVLGVAALSGDKAVGLAPYSNRGDIAAPGGGGLPQTCATADCANGVLSVYALDIPTTANGLAFWSGTSFAAPLVSGLFAQRYATYLATSGATPTDESELNSFVTSMSVCNSGPSVEGICIADMEDAPQFPVP